MSYQPTPIEEKIINIMQDEKREFKDSTVWVTPKVSYNMMDIIQTARKNYLGKFKNPKDERTGKEKFFVPMTEELTETIVKNIDLDSVDVNIRATTDEGRPIANILRYIVKHYMKEHLFGEKLNELIRRFCIDGTGIMKVRTDYSEREGKKVVDADIVDRTNFLIDPSADSIQDTGAAIERHLMKKSELRDYDWDNKEYAKVSDNSNLLDLNHRRGPKKQVPCVEVYERWGELPIGDDGEWVSAHAVVSNLAGSPVVHVLKEVDKKYKPYEEVRFRKVFGRWDGRGVGEAVMSLQKYINETLHLRINKSRLAQMGLFKIRKGSGITRQDMKGLISGGAVKLTRLDDVQPLEIPDVKPSSYKDEQETHQWAQRVTGAFDVSRGEGLPASQPATTAVIQQQGAQSGFGLLQENLGSFLGRIFERHIIPGLIENMDAEEIVNVVGSPEDLEEIDRSRAQHKANEFVIDYLVDEGMTEGDIIPDTPFINQLKESYKQKGRKKGNTRPIKVLKKQLRNFEYTTDVFVTGESFNKTVATRELNQLLTNYSRMPGVNIDADAIFREILDLMGLGGERFMKQGGAQAVPGIPRGQQPPERKTQLNTNQTEETAEAATEETVGNIGIR